MLVRMNGSIPAECCAESSWAWVTVKLEKMCIILSKTSLSILVCTHMNHVYQESESSRARARVRYNLVIFNRKKWTCCFRSHHQLAMNSNTATLSAVLLLLCCYTWTATAQDGCPSPLPVDTLVHGADKNGVIPRNRAGQVVPTGGKDCVLRLLIILCCSQCCVHRLAVVLYYPGPCSEPVRYSSMVCGVR